MFRQIFFMYCFSNINLYILETHGLKIPSDTGELIITHGYINETHMLKTEDGYHLTLHRITGKKGDPNYVGPKPVVLIGHGIVSSSATYVLAGPNKGLGYILSDKRYDIWLGNFRGNKYSQSHDTYSTLSKEFWDFSWHEMGAIDLPAMIKYILNETGVEKIFYIGYSQGTTAYFVFSSLHSEFADKSLHAAVALAPVVYLNHVRSSAINTFSRMTNRFLELSVDILSFGMKDVSSIYNVGKNRATVEKMMNLFCNGKQILDPLCKDVLLMLDGFDELQTNKTLLPIIYHHIPDGTSIKQLMHYAQIIKSGEFKMFDQGPLGNLINYQSVRPMKYDLSRSKVNVALFHSSSDWISTPQDVQKLSKELPAVQVYRVDYKNFNHLDFVFANDVKELLYNDVLSYMQTFL